MGARARARRVEAAGGAPLELPPPASLDSLSLSPRPPNPARRSSVPLPHPLFRYPNPIPPRLSTPAPTRQQRALLKRTGHCPTLGRSGGRSPPLDAVAMGPSTEPADCEAINTLLLLRSGCDGAHEVRENRVARAQPRAMSTSVSAPPARISVPYNRGSLESNRLRDTAMASRRLIGRRSEAAIFGAHHTAPPLTASSPLSAAHQIPSSTADGRVRK